MNIVDIILFVVITVIAIASAKKGFLMTVFNIAAFIISGILSKIFASPVAVYAYDNFFSQKIIDELYKIMPSGSVEGEISAITGEVIEALPSYIGAMINHFGVLEGAAADGTTTTLTVEMIAQSYIFPVVMNVLSIVATVLMFVLFVFILKIVFSIFNKGLTKKKHKLIRGTNMFFGAAFGVVKGAVIAAVLAAVLNIAAPVIGNEELSLFVNESAICNIVAEILK